jgi:tRNA A-37 threonylcarbamoyl transferase component Bud32
MTDAARQYQPGELVPGTIYRVLRHLATGGMGSVYDVEDTTVGKRYVLKTLHPNLFSRQDLARRMAVEARTLGRLAHPNIVEVVTAGQTTDAQPLPFYVMERLNGQNLRSVLERKGALSEEAALPIAIELLEALDHAHEHQVVHRDVKPENIFLHRSLTGQAVTKLLDFGIMRMIDENRSNDTAGRFVGTLRYAAPEQIVGGQVGPGTDLYAAGIVIYEMLAGCGPYDHVAKDLSQMGFAHLNERPPPLSQLAKVSPEVERMVMASLEKSPQSRPRDAFTFAAALRTVLQDVKKPAGRSNNTATDVHVLSELPVNAVPVRPMRAGTDLAEAATVAAGANAGGRAGQAGQAASPGGAPGVVMSTSPETAKDPALPFAETNLSDDGLGFVATVRDTGPVVEQGLAIARAATLPSEPGYGNVNGNASFGTGRGASAVDRSAPTQSIAPSRLGALARGSTENLDKGRPSLSPEVDRMQAELDREAARAFAGGMSTQAAGNTTTSGSELGNLPVAPKPRSSWGVFVVAMVVMFASGLGLTRLVRPDLFGVPRADASGIPSSALATFPSSSPSLVTSAAEKAPPPPTLPSASAVPAKPAASSPAPSAPAPHSPVTKTPRSGGGGTSPKPGTSPKGPAIPQGESPEIGL